MAVKFTCPLGSTCKKTDSEGNVIERCRWFMEQKGVKPDGTPDDIAECAVAMNVIMTYKAMQATHGVHAITESFRNEMVKGQEMTSQFIQLAVDQKLLS